MRAVVIGGGYGGMAAAVRLAKLGHRVSLVEAADAVGGALRPVRRDGFVWDASATSTLLPAVMRDLFRKSGRPLERELDLEPLPVLRQHHFADGSTLRLAGGRGAQVAAFEELADGLGQRWADYVAGYAEDWEVLRKNYFEVPWDPAGLPRELTERFGSRQTLARRLRRAFKDERARLVAAHPFLAEGHALRDVPAWAGLSAYLEQRFGGWRPVGGMAGLARALEARLATRRVEVLTATTALDLVVRAGRVAAVATSAGEIDADAVVVAIDPRRLPALRAQVAATLPALPPAITHVGLAEPPDHLAGLPAELVLHGDPTLVLRTARTAAGPAWTVHSYGTLLEDVLLALARHRIDGRSLDVRDLVITRVDLGPAELVRRWGGSPYGVRWAGRRTVFRRLGPSTPIPGVYAAGAHANPGAGLPYVGLSAALVAQAIGPA
ncbi:MAG: NAD(P)/FAD-dependent oxidoreductase [Nocardioides sp.]|uniref:phytoene desaturase family protein n=1 Tax=Nocardioides sp. TaxID=35761 RepID=UPI0039E4BA2D